MTIKLLLGECLARMAEIEDGSVGHVVTDPPYGQSNESYDKGVDPALWRECYRVTGPNAALISFAGSPTYHRIASDIEAAGWKVRQMWAWVYRDGMITSAYPKEGFDRIAPAMDPICFATKGKNLLSLEREGYGDWERGRYGCGYSSRSDGNTYALKAKGHWPRSIVATDGIEGFQYFILSRSGSKPDATGHPNQKPLDLMRWIVSKLPKAKGETCRECNGKGRPGWPECTVATFCHYCDGKGVSPATPTSILDPYAGSGTTLVAAQAEGFDSIGFERNPEYFAIAERRIAEAQAALPLFAGGAA